MTKNYQTTTISCQTGQFSKIINRRKALTMVCLAGVAAAFGPGGFSAGKAWAEEHGDDHGDDHGDKGQGSHQGQGGHKGPGPHGRGHGGGRGKGRGNCAMGGGGAQFDEMLNRINYPLMKCPGGGLGSFLRSVNACK